jgi:PAS domain-containing protein
VNPSNSPNNLVGPNAGNNYLDAHVARLLTSFRHWTGKDLIGPSISQKAQARELFNAPFAILSHDTAPDPILNYANEAGLRLFGLSWEELIRMPSRLTAQALEQDERARLLSQVSEQGYIGDYRGIRITKAGRRFLIERATVWNLLDESGAFYGQAATFSEWRFLD